jgi:hypothetical protein
VRSSPKTSVCALITSTHVSDYIYLGTITDDATLTMSWKDYDRRICLEYHVRLEGYHPGPLMKDPSNLGSGQLKTVYDNIVAGKCKFIKMTEEEVAILQQKVDSLMEDGPQEIGDNDGDDDGQESEEVEEDAPPAPKVGSKRKRVAVSEDAIQKKRKTKTGTHAGSVGSIPLAACPVFLLIRSHRPPLPLQPHLSYHRKARQRQRQPRRKSRSQQEW